MMSWTSRSSNRSLLIDCHHGDGRRALYSRLHPLDESNVHGSGGVDLNLTSMRRIPNPTHDTHTHTHTHKHVIGHKKHPKNKYFFKMMYDIIDDGGSLYDNKLKLRLG